MNNFGVIGGGILGLAVANELTRAVRSAKVTVLEKEHELASHQTGHNSGVVHAGIYYAPGSLKAVLCARGALLLKSFCVENNIAIDEVGKLVVATNSVESERLDAIEARARQNGIEGIRRLAGSEIAQIEPNVVGTSALHSPRTAIVDFRKVAMAFAESLRNSGHQVLTDHDVESFRQFDNGIQVTTSTGGPFRFDHVVVCAGLGTNRMAKRLGIVGATQVVPFRGEYYRLNASARTLVRGLVYPVPDPRYPFLGVHFTRRIDGEVVIGPNAVLALSLEGYSWADVSLHDMSEMLRWPGSWRLARKNFRTGIYELAGSLSQRTFVERARRYVPDIRTHQVSKFPAGVRAQAVGRDGSLLDDFAIETTKQITFVRNAPSPAATSSMAIAEHIVAGLSNAI